MRHAALPHSRDMAPQSPAPCPSARQGPAAEDERMRTLQPTLCLGRRQNTRLQTWQPPGAVPPNEKRFGVCECVCALVCVCVCMCVCTYTPLPGVPTFTPRWRWRGTRWRGRPPKHRRVCTSTRTCGSYSKSLARAGKRMLTRPPAPLRTVHHAALKTGKHRGCAVRANTTGHAVPRAADGDAAQHADGGGRSASGVACLRRHQRLQQR